jgi:hypothetical protein
MRTNHTHPDCLNLRFTATASEAQMKQLQTIMDETRYSRSEVIRMAINLLFETHRKQPQRFGVSR